MNVGKITAKITADMDRLYADIEDFVGYGGIF